MPTVGLTRAHQRLHVLDLLRFVAALSVLGYHFFFFGPRAGYIELEAGVHPFDGIARYGYLGVQLFFLISGFVILDSALGKTARQFVVGRLARLYPAYWVAVLVTAVAVHGWGGSLGLEVSGRQVLANLTMVAPLLGEQNIDGVYWTLVLEIWFYLVVFLFLVLRRGHRLTGFLPYWALGLAALSFSAPQLADVPVLGDTFALFASGALLATVRRSGVTPLRLAGLAAGWLTSLRSTLDTTAVVERNAGVDVSELAVAALLTLFFASLAAMCLPRVAALRIPFAGTLGDLTYPVYLLHAITGYIALSRFPPGTSDAVRYAVVLTGVGCLALVVNRLVEHGCRRQWRTLFDATAGRAVAWPDQLVPAGARTAPIPSTTIDLRDASPSGAIPRPRQADQLVMRSPR